MHHSTIVGRASPRRIKQIGGGLGFADAGYFTRFFRRQTDHTPSVWRALAAR